MINLFVTCQGSWCGSKLKLYDSQRGAITEDMLVTAEDIADALTERLRLAGWVTAGKLHFCPQHTPEMTGNLVTLTPEYALIGEGWEARTRGEPGTQDVVEIEVRRVVAAEPELASRP